MKTIWVKTADWHKVVDVDETIFENVFIEACTKAIEIKTSELKYGEDFLVNGVMYCTDIHSKKKSDHDQVVNTYKILINAAKYDRAELLRKALLDKMNVDLRDEPIMNNLSQNGKRKKYTK